MDSCETARYSLFRSQPNRVQFARLRAAPSILHINGTLGTGRLLSPEYNDQNITNGGSPCSSSVTASTIPAACAWSKSECRSRVSDSWLTVCAAVVSCDYRHKSLLAQMPE